MDTVIKWKDSDGEYQLFDNSEIDHRDRNHAISLFSGGVTVIASEGGKFITNSKDLAGSYRKQNKNVVMFSSLHPSDKAFREVGFLG